MQLNKNQIAIKSFSYLDYIYVEEEVEIQEKKLFKTTKISIPKSWLDDMGITLDEREIIANYEDKKIIIEKK